MADTIKCPVCGEVNAPDNEFCQNCRSRLQPLTGPLKGEGKPIKPGDQPTQKVTAELEPILPQWLRDARARARKSSEDEATRAAEEPPTAPAAKPDLLAGLASQARDDEEELPDWVSGIAGGGPAKKKKPETKSNQVRWVEVGGSYEEPDTSPIGATQVPAESSEEHTSPAWMAPREPAPERDELTDFPAWNPPQQEQASLSISEGSLEFNPEAYQPPAGEGANWMADLPPQSSLGQEAPAAPPETPDWMARLKEQAAEQAPPSQPAAAQPPAADVPDWLKSLDTGSHPQSAAPSQVPDWLKGMNSQPASEPAAAEESQASNEAPSSAGLDWLGNLASESVGAAEAPLESAPGPLDQLPDAPDWLSSLGSVPSESEAPAPASAFTFEGPSESQAPEAAEERPAAPAFSADSLAGSDVDSIFASMQIPDWLSSAAPEAAKTGAAELPPAAQSADLAPAELPSWVQAMRPVESGTPRAPTDSTLETRGPLAGLHGVLPGAPLGPTSKPRSHSIKLDATQEQQAHAELLEQILLAEAAPAPIKSAAALRSQRLLRWALAALVLTGALLSLLGGTQIFPLPLSAGPEINSTLKLIQAVPPAAPVLVVYDVDPSLSGEMEAVAGPVLDNLILLRQPRLTFLSTSPTGAALAEGLMERPLGAHGYQRGAQYQNLGYLPGGLAGVLSFALNPVGTLPLDSDFAPPWGTPPLLGVTHLSDFAAILIVTDSAESARVWVEQTRAARGASPLLVIASAQAGPLVMPYYASGQVSGLVSGLNGGALMEQVNGGRPGLVRRYWDAYSLGLLLAAGLITLGGLWNLLLGLQARGRARAEGQDGS
jgi:hypothetical protein